MRIATWNVNSLKARLPRVEEWLEYAEPDVLACRRRSSRTRTSRAWRSPALGYDSAPHGHNQWNGVAHPLQGRHRGRDQRLRRGERRPVRGRRPAVAAKCGGVNVVCVYVPNGREVGTEFYDRKLVWLEVLHDWIAKTYSPDRPAGRPRRLQRRARGPRRLERRRRSKARRT